MKHSIDNTLGRKIQIIMHKIRCDQNILYLFGGESAGYFSIFLL